MIKNVKVVKSASSLDEVKIGFSIVIFIQSSNSMCTAKFLPDHFTLWENEFYYD